MPQLTPVYFWEAEVEIECENLAFSLEAEDEGRGANKKRLFSASWLRDGQVYFNPPKRVAGWLKKQLPLARSSYISQVEAVKVYPADGDGEFILVCKVEELVGGQPLTENHELQEGLPAPMKRFIVVGDGKGGTRVTTTYWCELQKAKRFKMRIISFARGITPEIVEEALSKLGRVTGIGDKHSVGYGRFKLVSFKAEQERLKL